VVAENNIKLMIEYDGSGYAGWQYQPNQRTVQGKVEEAVRKLTGKKIALHAAGRTDAGVHAVGQVANFTIVHTLPVKKYRDGLNFYLPDDIVVRRADPVPPEFHSRFDAVFRHYRYTIGLRRSVAGSNRRWEIDSNLDIRLLNAAADHIMGDHDFTACCVVSSQKENNRCVVYRSKWTKRGETLCYDIAADRFLHTMIRSLVGLTVDAGRRTMTMRAFRDILHSGDHAAIRHVAPARGLCLIAVGY